MISVVAIRAIARHEWRRHWRSLVTLGVVGGLFGGAVVAGAALTRRTATAPDRLVGLTELGDAHVRVFGDMSLVEAIVDLPAVERSQAAGVAIGRVDGIGTLQYAGVLAPIRPTETLVRPVVIDGRPADPAKVDEVLISEDFVRRSGVARGDLMTMSMLSVDEVFQFDTGFGEPDGPTLELHVVGIARVPPGAFDTTPVLATPAFAAAHSDLFAGIDLDVALRGGRRSVESFSAAVAGLAASGARAGDDFPPATVDDPNSGTRTLIDSSRVLVGGSIATLLAAMVAVMVALGQGWARHSSTTAPRQRIERALGATAFERVAARTAPALVVGVGAGLIASAIGVAGGFLEPTGALRRIEPSPGWRAEWAVVAVGACVVALAVVVTATIAAWRAGRVSSERSGSRHASASALLPRRAGWPLVATLFATAPRAATGRATMRLAAVAVSIGVAGAVGAATFAASLDRLVSTPERFGWHGDLVIADVDDNVVDDLVADGRFAAVTDVRSGEVSVDDRSVIAYSFAARRGDATWEVLDGRLPSGTDEVMLGSTLADDLDISPGGRVVVGDTTMTVSGLGIGPAFSGEELGAAVLLDGPAFAVAAPTGTFREAYLRTASSVDVEEVAAELGGDLELAVRELPTEVRNIAELGSLPAMFGGFLALLALVALAHGVAVTTRERGDDFGVVRALGVTPAQVGAIVVTMTLTTVTIGVVIGVPLGWTIARLVWGGLARSVGVADDVLVPSGLAAIVAIAIALAGVVAAVPAWHAARTMPRPSARPD